ncbi:Gfo/Idh/MocA family protein [Paenibacillus lutimineralis]|uniref:Gfo/Idh/MocA family oxidoreductase n=1 Tax=Paenibacillus lutimineralis TaxID=2707005 RepID=A0A3Q9IF48_9BACL|nr:Gfo/Idh/MocA family oxidoreductase [Paenibacillus lutimineralis]AZS16785.1 gfo/Idh/MocA family oxidoreductase [Paenibacillus lutimineralis]
MKKVTAVLIGAGNRGALAYATYALEHPEELQFVAIAEPDQGRREAFQKAHNLPDSACYTSWEEMLQEPKLADAALICTQDQYHFDPAIKAFETGYHILLEKPMSTDPVEVVKLGQHAVKYERIFNICHVLRYTEFFGTLKKMVEDKKIGELVSIQHNENVAYWHQAHSYVRGNWRNSRESSPMILAKSCHDMDILLWLAGSDCRSISSFGSLSHFKAENAPPQAADRCTDNCPHAEECPFFAPRFYLANEGWRYALTNDVSEEGTMKALREGPYGRCVYKCDNDVVDHQVVNIEFENNVTAAFTMCAFTNEYARTIKLMGTRGEVKGIMSFNKCEIEITDFLTGKKELISMESGVDDHGGGDSALIGNFANLVREERIHEGLSSASVSVQSHLMSFAAEKSRLENQVVVFKDFAEEIKSRI